MFTFILTFSKITFPVTGETVRASASVNSADVTRLQYRQYITWGYTQREFLKYLTLGL